MHLNVVYNAIIQQLLMHSNNIPYFPFHPYYYPYYCGQNMMLYSSQNQFLRNFSAIPTSLQCQSIVSTHENSENNHQKQTKKTKYVKVSSKQDDQSFIIKSKKKKHSHINQKQNRNVVSNILRSFLKFLSTEKAKELMKKISQKFFIKTQYEEIQKWLEECGANYRNYVRSETIFKMIRKEKGQKSRLFLILYSNYAKNHLRAHFLTSSKLKEENKTKTLSSIRQIGDKLNEIYLESASY